MRLPGHKPLPFLDYRGQEGIPSLFVRPFIPLSFLVLFPLALRSLLFKIVPPGERNDLIEVGVDYLHDQQRGVHEHISGPAFHRLGSTLWFRDLSEHGSIPWVFRHSKIHDLNYPLHVRLRGFLKN